MQVLLVCYNSLLFLLWIEIIQVSGANIALRKPTLQSTVHSIFTSERAVDGDWTTWINGRYMCTHTINQDKPWWVVDLGDTYEITNVIIYNRNDSVSSWLSNYDIHVFATPGCSGDKWATFSRGQLSRCHFQYSSVTYLNATCKNDSIGRFVRIKLRNKARLCLCEVEICGDPVLSPTDISSSKKACGFQNKEYDGIELATTKAGSNIECVLHCMTTEGCCAGVYEESTSDCTLKRKFNTDENTSHSFLDNQLKTSWLV